MSKRIDKSWLVFASVENEQHDRCVDFFRRPDATHGFEEFRRDSEDRGEWTPVGSFASLSYASPEAARAAAMDAIRWYSLETGESRASAPQV
jgi:hypothetical protein